MKLSGKIALVTGGGRGIGRGCAVELAREGAGIILNDRPGSPDLAAAAEEIRALGRTCWPVEGDVFTRDGCETLVAAGLAAAGRIDILVSNPAARATGEFLDLPTDEFERVLRGTLTSAFHMSQLVCRHLVERGRGGKILFISSVHSFMPFPREVAYNTAKAGLEQMMRTLAAEMVRHRINVNAVAPGWIDTPRERELFPGEVLERAAKEIPWGRMGRPEDIGRAAVYLCSGDADYLTAQVLVIDGGFGLKAVQDHQTPGD